MSLRRDPNRHPVFLYFCAVAIGTAAGAAGAMFARGGVPSLRNLLFSVASLCVVPGAIGALFRREQTLRVAARPQAVVVLLYGLTAGAAAAADPRWAGPVSMVFWTTLLVLRYTDLRCTILHAGRVAACNSLLGAAVLFWVCATPGLYFQPEPSASVGVQTLALAVMLSCTLRGQGDLRAWDADWSFGRPAAWMLIAGSAFLFLAMLLHFFFADSPREAAAWAGTVRSVWMIGLGLVLLAFPLALSGALLRSGAVEAREEWILTASLISMALLGLKQVTASACVVACMVVFFLLYVRRTLHWSSILLHLASAAAVGGVSLLLLLFAGSPWAWLLYGALLGAACGLDAVHAEVLRSLADTFRETGHLRGACEIYEVLAAEDPRAAWPAATTARDLGEPGRAAAWFERAARWQDAGECWLESAKATPRAQRL